MAALFLLLGDWPITSVSLRIGVLVTEVILSVLVWAGVEALVEGPGD